MGRFRQHPAVRAELRSAARWYEERAGLGIDLFDDFDSAVDAIIQQPQAWPLWSETAGELEIRRHFLSRFPYYVPYLLGRHGDVLVLAFAHTKRRPGYWLERLPRKRR